MIYSGQIAPTKRWLHACHLGLKFRDPFKRARNLLPPAICAQILPTHNTKPLFMAFVAQPNRQLSNHRHKPDI